jgi:NADH:ubiquinone reductase (H+-translocating)
MLFTPLLPEAASGTLEPRHVVVPLRVMCRHAELGSRSGPSRGCCRCPASRSMGTGSATSRTRSRSASTSQQLEAADAARSPDDRARHLAFASSAPATQGSKRWRSSPTSFATRCAINPGLRTATQGWVLVDAAPRILPEIPARLGEYAAAQLTRRGVEIHVSTRLED